MKSFEFQVPGPPVVKARPRSTTTSTGKRRTYTPDKTAKYESKVASFALIERPRGWPLDLLYAVSLEFYLPDKRRRDIDNLAKSVLDGLNGIGYADDAQISTLIVVKKFDKKYPRVDVVVTVQEVAP
jgi:crossover junction endodeoxyribonuclease RusA